MRIAMINNTGLVYNTVVWDGISAWTPHTEEMEKSGWRLVDVTKLPEIGMGWTFDGKDFTPPAPRPTPVEEKA